MNGAVATPVTLISPTVRLLTKPTGEKKSVKVEIPVPSCKKSPCKFMLSNTVKIPIRDWLASSCPTD